MTTLLLSFLGRSPRRDVGGYRQTEYRFDDGSVDRAAFFGFSLLRRLRPDRLVIFGTAGSMWDHLFERDVVLGDAMEGERLALIDAVAEKAVTQAMLDDLVPALAGALDCDVELRLIPYARNEQEQIEIVQTLAAAVPTGSALHLDITHGYRHLPLIATMALQYLRALRPGVELKAIWYGAYDEDSGEAPVHDLAGLLGIASGSDAIARFDHSGDYAALAELLPADAQELLRQAAFLERTHQTGQARGRVRAARALIEGGGISGLAKLFEDALRQRIGWVDENRLYQRQRALALESLKRGDELRTALYGFEALITRFMQRHPAPGENPDNFDHRQEAKARIETAGRERKDIEFENYRLLRDIRNQLAHGVSSPRAEVQRAMADEAALRTNLNRLLHSLLPESE